MRQSQVTLIIPSRNELQLQETLTRLQQVLHDLPVHYHVESDPEGTGVGATLRRGVLRATTPWVLFVMADGSEDPRCVRELVEACLTGTYWAVWGDRWILGTVTGYPWWKRGLNRLGNRLIRRLTHVAYEDWTDLAKAYRRAILLQITWADDFRCAVQIPLRARRQALRVAIPLPIRVVPMHWTERTAGRSAYRLRHAFYTIVTLLRTLWEA